MKKEDVFIIVKEILKTRCNVTAEIKEDTALIGENILDSLDFLNYLTIIEEKFGIEIPDEDIPKYQLGIINNMIAYLSR
jgi:acyl carrier protein